MRGRQHRRRTQSASAILCACCPCRACAEATITTRLPAILASTVKDLETVADRHKGQAEMHAQVQVPFACTLPVACAVSWRHDSSDVCALTCAVPCMPSYGCFEFICLRLVVSVSVRVCVCVCVYVCAHGLQILSLIGDVRSLRDEILARRPVTPPQAPQGSHVPAAVRASVQSTCEALKLWEVGSDTHTHTHTHTRKHTYPCIFRGARLAACSWQCRVT